MDNETVGPFRHVAARLATVDLISHPHFGADDDPQATKTARPGALRQVRVTAVKLIPALIDKLKDEATEVIRTIEKAKTIAASLK